MANAGPPPKDNQVPPQDEARVILSTMKDCEIRLAEAVNIKSKSIYPHYQAMTSQGKWKVGPCVQIILVPGLLALLNSQG